MGNISGLVVAIVVAILGYFGWKSLDSRLGTIQNQVESASEQAQTPSPLLQRIEAPEESAITFELLAERALGHRHANEVVV